MAVSLCLGILHAFSTDKIWIPDYFLKANSLVAGKSLPSFFLIAPVGVYYSGKGFHIFKTAWWYVPELPCLENGQFITGASQGREKCLPLNCFLLPLGIKLYSFLIDSSLVIWTNSSNWLRWKCTHPRVRAWTKRNGRNCDNYSQWYLGLDLPLIYKLVFFLSIRKSV